MNVCKKVCTIFHVRMIVELLFGILILATCFSIKSCWKELLPLTMKRISSQAHKATTTYFPFLQLTRKCLVVLAAQLCLQCVISPNANGGNVHAFTFVPSSLIQPPLSVSVSVSVRQSQSQSQSQSTFKVKATTNSETVTPPNKAQPRSGIGQALLNIALKSPLWKNVMVPQARSTMVKTAEANGIPWSSCKEWIRTQSGPWSSNGYDKNIEQNVKYPEYYLQSYHAYETGNLSWDAAWEQEIASRAVGARNFPKFGDRGEDAFRSSFEQTLLTKCGAVIPPNGTDNGNKKVVVDFGCGTGISTRRLAEIFPSEDKKYQNTEFIGIDLSPYFVSVGQWLLQNQPKAFFDDDGANGPGPWVNTIPSDPRIQLQVGDVTNLASNHNNVALPPESANVVNLSFVLHELPVDAIQSVIEQAYQTLIPGGQMWISEMDFDSPAYAAQRANPMLFSLLRATEPYLDEYADGMEEVRAFIAQKFDRVVIEAATGRHYALVATKGLEEKNTGEACVIEDRRFKPDGSYCVEDTHLLLWESKDNSNDNI